MSRLKCPVLNCLGAKFSFYHIKPIIEHVTIFKTSQCRTEQSRIEFHSLNPYNTWKYGEHANTFNMRHRSYNNGK